MIEDKIFAVYVYLGKKPPRRFIIKRMKLHPLRDIYEVYKPRTLYDFVSKLFIILDEIHPGFMRNITEKDEEQFQTGISKRRFVAEKRADLVLYNKNATEPKTKQILNYWVVSNLNEKDVKRIVDFSCKAAGIRCESLSNLHL